MKLASSRDLARSASSSLETIAVELDRLKAVVMTLTGLEDEEPGLDDHAPGRPDQTSAFRFGDAKQSVQDPGIRRPSLPDPNLLEKIARNRRRRNQHFGDRLFDDPAWDMILDLAIARARFRRVSVTSLCIASGVPSTTALRWITVLVERGLCQRENDDRDKRRSFISLTDAGSLKVARYFDSIGANNLALI